jgi:hypothetical protein
MGGPTDSREDDFTFADEVSIKKIRRSRLKDSGGDLADIKTLMSKEHRVIDLIEIDQSHARRMTEKQLADARGPDGPGLLALYPIDRVSPPDAVNRHTRTELNAADDVIGAAVVFPGTGSEEAVKYISADLARLGMSEDEVEESENEDPDEQLAT